MKGGKGGMGRKKPTTQPKAKTKNPLNPKNPHDGPKRGVPKKDWGANPDRDEPTKPSREK
jgi:hypothetical protein